MLFPVAIIASFALVQQVPAPPASTESPPIVQAETTAPPPASVPRPVAATTEVCRMEAVTGSRFGRRVCRSPLQTEEERADSREMLRQMQGARLPPVG